MTASRSLLESTADATRGRTRPFDGSSETDRR